LPPSLRNIFIELKDDLDIDRLNGHGDLTEWAKQGVLLLNSILTVEKAAPASHAGYGWAHFTDTIIYRLGQSDEHKVFVLWGNHAQAKEQYIDKDKHSVIISSHPSPFSATKGFFGSRPFSKINALLEAHGQELIDWRK
jgi:uracil-DNA glycosylase